MTRLTLLLNSFTHYFKANLLVITGVAISTAVLTGALIVGDSVTFSLEQSAFYRLGSTTHVVSTLDRFFREDLANDIAIKGGFDVAPALILEGMAVAEGGNERVNKVQIIGINDRFEKIAKSQVYNNLSGNDVIISTNLSERLRLKKGDSFIVRIKKASLIPLNAPFVSDVETNVSFRATVKEFADQQNLGFFNLKNAQTAPFNLFLSLSKMNSLLKFEKKANRLLISAPLSDDQNVSNLLDSCFTTEDAGLKVKQLPLTNEAEITSDRVFLEDPIVKAFESFKDSHAILTYFVNSLGLNGKSTPYSFISTIDDKTLNNNDIIVNSWVADDLNGKVGDSLTIKYFHIGPLRQLVEKEKKFIIRKIVPIEGKYADKDLMPNLPGLSNAGHCRDWEAGVPIKLGSIRTKDEDYWKKYKGTPKTFISLKSAQEIWSNRFGNYTAIRIPGTSFSDNTYKALFLKSVKPENLGVIATSVRSDGLKAARNGVDFSQLLLGLSFFLLAAAIILTALLFLLNLENRQSELGTLLILGFSRNQIRNLLLCEGVMISLAGSLIGLILAVLYTKLIFAALNTLWWDAVRTSVLLVDIKASTLDLGLIISVLIAIITIFSVVHQSFKRQAVELQRQQDKKQKPVVRLTKNIAMSILLVLSFGILCFQLMFSNNLSSSLFFLSGGCLLTGLLILADFMLRRNRNKVVSSLSYNSLNQRNRSQNPGRSITIIILFALGTFLVISTGANRGDSLSDSSAKRTGTGGYKYFAETSIPVLFSLNDKEHRVKEGITSQFSVAQFSRIDGDDASCLNLNRASNPAILGADPELFSERFTFDTKCPEIGDMEIWKALDKPFVDNVVPAIADQSVIQWGLGKNIGDTLIYRNEMGQILKLKLIGGLSPSVFQGNILISNTNFLKNFPTTSGSHIFLIDGDERAGEELNNLFRDYGWEMSTTVQRLIEFNSVENTYLSIFLALGALGLILGTVGLAVVLARSILIRKDEINLMRSVGFTQKQIIRLILSEYSVLLIWGVLIGFISAAIAIFPTFISSGGKVQFWAVLLIVALILINGVSWIFGLSWFGVRQKSLVISSAS